MPSLRAPAVPAHLRKYVVEQDYEQYTEVDHAVWRFVLLQVTAQLERAAHPAYETGLAATGIGLERIPRIEEMNERLSRFGWGAVCVDGFIPPRAFQGFQANRILPIAAEIRTPEHLAYTPAPDIIHEAAGHAPILSDPEYAHYVQAIGAVSEKAFASPQDRSVYEAIHLLSELKEDPSSTPSQLAAAERSLEIALAGVTEVSEAARLARLYWWTAEYGLVGTPERYQIYGAGLLSSLGESRSCHDASVRKLPLTSACVDVDYDITRAQPQLFVARDFAHLMDVLAEVERGLSYRNRGEPALETARRSDELATLSLDTGIDVIGIVSAVHAARGRACALEVKGAPALSRDGVVLEGARCPGDVVVPFGALVDGRGAGALSPEDVRRHAGPGGRLALAFSSGVCVTGILRDVHAVGGRADWLLLERFELTLPDGRVFRSQPPYPLPLASTIPAVRAGAPAGYFGPSSPGSRRVPRPRWLSPRDRRLLGLYEEALEAWTSLAGSELTGAFERIASDLDRHYPEDWLLRWNLLESLVKAAQEGSLSSRLERALLSLEVRYRHEQPIARGLSAIRAIGGQQGQHAEAT